MEDLYGRKKAYVNTGLIALNVLYFLFLEATGSSENTSFMVAHGAMYAPLVIEKGEYYRLITSVFMHFGISHIMNNMLILFILGDNLERALGHIKYLFFYLICGVGANIVSMAVNLGEYRNVVSAGASGAIFGVIGGLLYAVIINRGRLEDLSTSCLVLRSSNRPRFIRRHHKSWPVGRSEYQTAGCDDCMFPVFWLYQHRC